MGVNEGGLRDREVQQKGMEWNAPCAWKGVRRRIDSTVYIWKERRRQAWKKETRKQKLDQAKCNGMKKLGKQLEQ